MSQQGPHPIRVSARSRPPMRWRGWRVTTWLVLAFVALLTVAIELVALFLIGISHASTCYEEPRPADVLAGHRAQGWLLVAVVLPWVLACIWARPRLRVALTGLLCTSPAVLSWIYGSNTDFWVGGFCF